MELVEFYFDYLSPFAYLASLTVPELCERHGARVEYRPILLSGLLNHWGQLGPAEIPPKAAYAFRTCLRHARLRGITLRSPTYHPFNPLTALRATLSAGPGEKRARAVRALYALGWARGGDLGDPHEIAAALEEARLEGEELVARTKDEDVKALLKLETERAIARGVFGVPTMVVADDLFWGFDHSNFSPCSCKTAIRSRASIGLRFCRRDRLPSAGESRELGISRVAAPPSAASRSRAVEARLRDETVT